MAGAGWSLSTESLDRKRTLDVVDGAGQDASGKFVRGGCNRCHQPYVLYTSQTSQKVLTLLNLSIEALTTWRVLLTYSIFPSESFTPRESGLTIAYPRAVHSAGSGASNFSKSERREVGTPTRPGILSSWKKPGGKSLVLQGFLQGNFAEGMMWLTLA